MRPITVTKKHIKGARYLQTQAPEATHLSFEHFVASMWLGDNLMKLGLDDSNGEIIGRFLDKTEKDVNPWPIAEALVMKAKSLCKNSDLDLGKVFN